MVDNQRANKTNTEKRRKKKKKSLVEEQSNFSLSSSGLTPLASSSVCLRLLGRFGAGVWWCWESSFGGHQQVC
jgi:hypothetical protein